MKASKFTDAQKAFVIKQGEEGTRVAGGLERVDPEGLARSCRSTHQATTTSPVSPIRPYSEDASRPSARRMSATAITVFITFVAGKAG